MRLSPQEIQEALEEEDALSMELSSVYSDAEDHLYEDPYKDEPPEEPSFTYPEDEIQTEGPSFDEFDSDYYFLNTDPYGKVGYY